MPTSDSTYIIVHMHIAGHIIIPRGERCHILCLTLIICLYLSCPEGLTATCRRKRLCVEIYTRIHVCTHNQYFTVYHADSKTSECIHLSIPSILSLSMTLGLYWTTYTLSVYHAFQGLTATCRNAKRFLQSFTHPRSSAWLSYQKRWEQSVRSCTRNTRG